MPGQLPDDVASSPNQGAHGLAAECLGTKEYEHMEAPIDAVGNVNLTDRRALVTGGASGIGLACARRLASTGAAVTIADNDANGAITAASEIGGESWIVDLTETALLRELRSRFRHPREQCRLSVRRPDR